MEKKETIKSKISEEELPQNMSPDIEDNTEVFDKLKAFNDLLDAVIKDLQDKKDTKWAFH